MSTTKETIIEVNNSMSSYRKRDENRYLGGVNLVPILVYVKLKVHGARS